MGWKFFLQMLDEEDNVLANKGIIDSRDMPMEVPVKSQLKQFVEEYPEIEWKKLWAIIEKV